MDDLTKFIDGCLEVLPDPRPTHQHSSIISEIYYLLADDFLKIGDNQLSQQNYNAHHLSQLHCIVLFFHAVMPYKITCQTCPTAQTGLIHGLVWLWPDPG